MAYNELTDSLRTPKAAIPSHIWPNILWYHSQLSWDLRKILLIFADVNLYTFTYTQCNDMLCLELPPLSQFRFRSANAFVCWFHFITFITRTTKAAPTILTILLNIAIGAIQINKHTCTCMRRLPRLFYGKTVWKENHLENIREIMIFEIEYNVSSLDSFVCLNKPKKNIHIFNKVLSPFRFICCSLFLFFQQTGRKTVETIESDVPNYSN